MTLLKEAWLQEIQEIVAAYNDPTPNEPGTLYRYVYPPHSFSVGYTIEILKDEASKWGELKAGVLAGGLLTEKVMAALANIPRRMWSPMPRDTFPYDMPRDPPTWAMYLYGKYPFGPGEWNIFGFTSRNWEEVIDKYEGPPDPKKEDAYKPKVRLEIQFQVRPAEKGVKEWIPAKNDPAQGEEEDALYNSLVDALRTVSGVKNHELKRFLEDLDEAMDEDDEVYERFEQEAPRIIANLPQINTWDMVRIFDYILTGQGL